MAEAVNEMSHYRQGDYLVINDDFDTALNDLRSILHAVRLSRSSQMKRHPQLLKELLN
jgi:guanylate kinase